jgi:hypothetical protein
VIHGEQPEWTESPNGVGGNPAAPRIWKGEQMIGLRAPPFEAFFVAFAKLWKEQSEEKPVSDFVHTVNGYLHDRLDCCLRR